MGTVTPHALTEQVATRAIGRDQLPQVEHLGEGTQAAPLDVAHLKANEYWHAHDSLYPGGSARSREWGWVRAKVLERDEHRCCVCASTEALQVDHIKPLSQGGGNAYRNLWTLCRECHSIKTGRSLKNARLTEAQRQVADVLKDRDHV